jgi:hypothetical protein
MAHTIEPTTYYKFNEFDFSELKFNIPGKNKKFINVFYEKKTVGFKFPKLKIPFDTVLSKYGKLEVNFSLGNDQSLIDSCKEFDKQIQEFAESKGWLSGNETYSSTLKESRATQNNGQPFPPTVRFTIPSRDDKFTTNFYDNDKKQITVKNVNDITAILKKGRFALCAIEFSGVWFFNNMWGCSFKVDQIRMVSGNQISETPQNDYLFEDSSDDSDAEYGIVDDE